MAEERLQKVLAAAGVASRRASEELITAGRVSVNGQRVTELGTKVDPARATIMVDGKPIALPARQVYLKLHKPRGVISDLGGATQGRQTVEDLLPPEMRRLFPVGRLDLNSEGLILMTDDGDLAHKLTHPRFEHPKTYFVLIADRPPESALEQLRKGVDLPEGRTAPAEVRVAQRLPEGLKLAPGPTHGVWLEVVLREGKKRQIRHMTAAIGFPTLRLVRWAIGPLTLDDLPVGETRPLTRGEVAALRGALRGLRIGGQRRPTAPGGGPASAAERPTGPPAAARPPQARKEGPQEGTRPRPGGARAPRRAPRAR